jgi:hypothetical protein
MQLILAARERVLTLSEQRVRRLDFLLDKQYPTRSPSDLEPYDSSVNFTAYDNLA